MTESVTILALVGSLRADSYNLHLARAAVSAAPDGVRVQVRTSLGELPFFNEDLESDPPPQVDELRRAVTGAHAVLFVVPQYNGSMPGLVKNAIDWLSRPHGAGVLSGTPVAVIGTSPSPHGGRYAHEATRAVLAQTGASLVEGAALSVTVPDLDDGTVRGCLRDMLATLARTAPEPHAA